MLEMVFELIEGRMVPRLPRATDGTERKADGVRFFNIAQASTFTRRTEDDLRTDWKLTWDDLLSEDESPLAASTLPVGSVESISPRTRAKLDLLRLMVYPHLNDQEFEYFVEVCRQRGLNPWSKQLWPERTVDPDTHRATINIITTIIAFRLIADRTGKYAGQRGPQWCGEDGHWMDVWTSEKPPVAARIGILRHGFIEPCWGIAHWRHFVQMIQNSHGELEVSEMWRKMDALMLAKCSEANGFRRAFPEEFADLHTMDEMMQARNPTPRNRPAVIPAVADEDQTANQYVEQDVPQTPRQFQMALIELGLKNPVKRSEVIARLYRELGARYEGTAFYAAAIARVRKNPSAYGAQSPEPANV